MGKTPPKRPRPRAALRRPVDKILASYDPSKLTIATIGSHTGLQIFHGARLEGFKSLGIVLQKKKRVYDAFPRARPDDYLTLVNSYKELLDHQDELIARNTILVPHGSFVEYVGARLIAKELKVPVFGNKASMEWESDRKIERRWLKMAGCKVPRIYKDPSEIDGPCIIKYYGAKGGKDFFIVTNAEDFYKKIKRRHLEDKTFTIQEFVIGARYYHQMFYTPLSKKAWPAGRGSVELMGIDRRIESNIDELHRFGFTREEMDDAGIVRSFVVTGNEPMVVRESLLDRVFEMAAGVVDTSIELFDPGLIGPFCLETILTPELEFYVFEISARIVAGTNLYPVGSPYTPYTHGVAMSTGRRVAREIKKAAALGRLGDVCS
ncbi:MAG TPA: formate--phosphoribosylaminoimidazolecarboxamide ligase [Candidatus Thermoplasmatota archaeon]|nr:formate--phosphoribosylaminoimidazolecarboxamide ligase [Candidatus Thermoplasmatota archaeon]